MTNVRRFLAVSSLAVLPLVGACAGEDDDALGGDRSDEVDEGGTQAPVTPAGFEVVEGDGVSIAVPGEWQGLDLTAGDIEAILDEVESNNPEMADVLGSQAQALLSQGAVLFAIAPPEDDFSDNVNVIEVPGRVPSFDEMEDQIEGIISSFGGELEDTSRVEVPAGAALRVLYSAEFAGADGAPVAVQGVQYYVVADDDLSYVVTVTLGSGGDPELADEIAGTFATT
ncbi:MAG: hypothetical protein AB7L84_09990 [Acidimicrobiia bacterium]